MRSSEFIQTDLTAETLCKVDQRFNDEVTAEIQAAVLDCLKRPNIKKVRSFSIELRLRPKHERGQLEFSTKVSSVKRPPREFDVLTAIADPVSESIEFLHKQGELFSETDPAEVELILREREAVPVVDHRAKAAGE